MKGVCICKRCIEDIRNDKSIPNLEKLDPDNTLRDILKYCVPHMKLHQFENLCLCSPCVEILKSLEDHVKRYTNLDDIHDGRIPEDIGDFVKYCMRSFNISSDSKNALNNKKCKIRKKIKDPRLMKLKKIKKRVKLKNKKKNLRKPLSSPNMGEFKRTKSLDSILHTSEKQKIPMICNHYLNSMLEKSNFSEREKSSSNYSELFIK